jgi:DNA-directed RNA polymerase subunit K/omega
MTTKASTKKTEVVEEETIENISDDESIQEEEEPEEEEDEVEEEVEETDDEDVEAEEEIKEEKEEEEEQSETEEEEEPEEGKKTKNSKTSKKTVVNTIGIEELKATKKTQVINYDDDEEEEEEDVNYLQKFDAKMRDNFILDHHPEAKTHNYEEVKALARVTRDGRGIIIDPLHKTIPFLTKYEMTRVIGQRAKQLDSGARAFVSVPLNVIDGYHIALLELEQKKLPFIIKRPYPTGGVEYWNVSDLELLL